MWCIAELTPEYIARMETCWPCTSNRTSPRNRWSAWMRSQCPSTRTIHLVMDNLSTHGERSLTRHLGERHGRSLWRRLTVHYTPKHGSWLNQAEGDQRAIAIAPNKATGTASIASACTATFGWNAIVTSPIAAPMISAHPPSCSSRIAVPPSEAQNPASDRW